MKLKGYIFSRPFLGERVPQHIQNIVIRDYCVTNNITFLMSATEYAVEESSYILSELIHNLKNYDGIIFYSLFQLPIKKKDRHQVYNSIIKRTPRPCGLGILFSYEFKTFATEFITEAILPISRSCSTE